MNRIATGIAEALLITRIAAWYAAIPQSARQMMYLALFVLAAASLLPILALVNPNFCASLDPARYAIMDGAGGALLRAIFYRC